MKTKLSYTIFLTLLVFACSETNDLEQDYLFDISGYWINQQLNDTVYTYEKSSALLEGQYCFGFKENGEFIERKNSGWCATPPISYADFEGSWIINDSIVEINVDFWGGMAYYKWKIISLDEHHMSFIEIEADHQMAE